jgi:hypothetical protein
MLRDTLINGNRRNRTRGPKARNKPAQGNALGKRADQASPEAARQPLRWRFHPTASFNAQYEIPALPGRLSEFDLYSGLGGVGELRSVPPHGSPAHGYNTGANRGLYGASTGSCSHASLRNAGYRSPCRKAPIFVLRPPWAAHNIKPPALPEVPDSAFP